MIFLLNTNDIPNFNLVLDSRNTLYARTLVFLPLHYIIPSEKGKRGDQVFCYLQLLWQVKLLPCMYSRYLYNCLPGVQF